MNPFTSHPQESIASLGEVRLIQVLRETLGDASAAEPYGIGDDCAVFAQRAASSLGLVTADPILYGKHFDDALSPEQSAAKLLKRNLSDIAAMGGIPTQAILSLALPPKVSLSWITRFYGELARLARRYAVNIAGGDISSSDETLGAFMTLIGETLPGYPALLRHRATSGCPVYVTGELGGTRARKHFAFEPRLAEGQWLAQRQEVLSCSDISDGLGKDLVNLLSPGTCAVIDAARLPIAEAAERIAGQSGQPALYHALNDGEDFELVFALRADADTEAFESAWKRDLKTRLTLVGVIENAPKAGAPALRLRHAPDTLSATGYEHLRET